ncbi:hypothetical protein DFH27DRAFT_226475 [Peziza echinospora]|nr:hypothetical protein DFH27DRAFT_226475 [Peziza echinospora]
MEGMVLSMAGMPSPHDPRVLSFSSSDLPDAAHGGVRLCPGPERADVIAPLGHLDRAPALSPARIHTAVLPVRPLRRWPQEHAPGACCSLGPSSAWAIGRLSRAWSASWDEVLAYRHGSHTRLVLWKPKEGPEKAQTCEKHLPHRPLRRKAFPTQSRPHSLSITPRTCPYLITYPLHCLLFIPLTTIVAVPLENKPADRFASIEENSVSALGTIS